MTTTERRYGVQFLPILDVDLDEDGNVLGIDLSWSSSFNDQVYDYRAMADLPLGSERDRLGQVGSDWLDELIPAINGAIAQVVQRRGKAFVSDNKVEADRRPFEFGIAFAGDCELHHGYNVTIHTFDGQAPCVEWYGGGVDGGVGGSLLDEDDEPTDEDCYVQIDEIDWIEVH